MIRQPVGHFINVVNMLKDEVLHKRENGFRIDGSS
jgi:hypothetical protein